jgi:hypothetical protein
MGTIANSLADKLESAGLTEAEKTVLALAIHTAATEADDDVTGFGLLGFNPLAPPTASDKMGNFEIQNLMSRFNQAEALASALLKKSDDTSNAVIGKI